MSVTKFLQVRMLTTYLDECERELATAEALIAALPARKRGAMAADIADLDAMKRDLAQRRQACSTLEIPTRH